MVGGTDTSTNTIEFAMAEELDTLVAKWRAYSRYSFMWNDWRWVLGGIVS